MDALNAALEQEMTKMVMLRADLANFEENNLLLLQESRPGSTQ